MSVLLNVFIYLCDIYMLYINISTYIYTSSFKPHGFLWDRHYITILQIRQLENREVK